MADVQHKDIPNNQLHEPKGVSGASPNTVYVANGSGSGSWQSAPFDPSNFTIERLVDGKAPTTSQNPNGTGEGGQIQVTFGAAQNTINDPVQLLSDGSLVFNEGGLYRVKITLVYGRIGGAGVSELRFRALVNGTQAGQTIGTKLGAADVAKVYTDEAWLDVPAGAVITYQIMRDTSGNNSGGLIPPVVTSATAPDWNDTTPAAIRVERWVK